MGERPATEARMQAVKHPQSIATKVCHRDAWAYRALLLELATSGAMERQPLFLPASNGDFRDAAMIVGDDQCIFSSSWQASLVDRGLIQMPIP
jgi:hypothetical protein